jgi:magnesium-transporting ATPase (P-type)
MMNEPSIQYFPRIDENPSYNNNSEIILNPEFQPGVVNLTIREDQNQMRKKKIFFGVVLATILVLVLFFLLFYVFLMNQITSMIDNYFNNFIFQFRNAIKKSTKIPA